MTILEVELLDLPQVSFTPSTDLVSAVFDAARAAEEIGGVVYLLHFDRPYQHIRHYTGWTSNLDNRLAKHAAGRGARLLEVISEAGIGWKVARTWKGTRHLKRALKRRGGASRRCPLCGVIPREETTPAGGQQCG